ncbi:tRNA(Met) cytidine acetyltransferase TmcA [Pokkaliibacter plantistimulans]|nr:GNAT family N-acetyltransferase [Pokkaliibacter plantistimulans]
MTLSHTDHLTDGTALHHWLQRAASHGHRLPVILQGESLWITQQLQHWQAALPPQPLYLGPDYLDHCECKTLRAASLLLGQERQCVIFDSRQALDVDALAAASGLVTAGGVFIWLLPPSEQWQQQGAFHQRLLRLLEADSHVWLIQAQRQRTPQLTEPRRQADHHLSSDPDCLSEDQAIAVQRIIRTAQGRARRPLVIQADRGRGKSSALGLAAARLIHLGMAAQQPILVTAPRQAACAEVLAQAQRHLSAAQAELLRYISPDQLLDQLPDAALLLVDEAASLPAAVLQTLLQRYPRVIFASTVHGYEGTGRGFAVRFVDYLNQHAPAWKGISLSTPIRWRDHDPLETLIRQWLLLDAEPHALTTDRALTTPTTLIQETRADVLASDEALLHGLFGLLVQAHYRTTPSDLQQLLADPQCQTTLALSATRQVMGAAVLVQEGPLEPSLAEAVWLGQRRPKGQLLPQSLLFHCGLRHSGQLRYGRIMRVAVATSLRQQGIGLQLLQDIEQRARRQGLDCLGSSFGATDYLLRFWQKAGYCVVRLGLTRDAASGEYAVMVLKPLNSVGHALVQDARRRFLHELPELLNGALQRAEPALLHQLLAVADLPAVSLSSQDRDDLQAFIRGNRDLLLSRGALKRLLLLALKRGADAQACLGLIGAVLQQCDETLLCQRLACSPGKPLSQLLRRQAQVLLAWLEQELQG